MNTLSLFMFCSAFEHYHGTNRTILVYFLGGLGGNLSAAIGHDAPSVGASSAVCGILGASIADMLMNWDVMARRHSRRTRWLIFMLFIFMMHTVNSNIHSNIDKFGHVGGFLSGFIVAYSIL